MTLNGGNNNDINHNNNAIHTNTIKYQCIHSNPEYFIRPILSSMESIDAVYTSYMDEDMYHASVSLVQPWKHTIQTIADTGANLNAKYS